MLPASWNAQVRLSAAAGRSRYLIGRASSKNLVNVISWLERASLFTFPKHTHNKKWTLPIESVMYITDSTSQLRYIWRTSRADGGVLGQDLILAVEDEPPSSEGAHEPLPCAQLTLGIDPRRTNSGV